MSPKKSWKKVSRFCHVSAMSLNLLILSYKLLIFVQLLTQDRTSRTWSLSIQFTCSKDCFHLNLVWHMQSFLVSILGKSTYILSYKNVNENNTSPAFQGVQERSPYIYFLMYGDLPIFVIINLEPLNFRHLRNSKVVRYMWDLIRKLTE